MYNIFNPIKALPDKALRGYKQYNIVNFLGTKKSFLLAYRHGGELASSIIDRMCEGGDINPKILLVTLQREQGLIMMSNEVDVKSYRRPDGRIINQLDAACGVGMFDDKTIEKYLGFTNQIKYACSTYDVRFKEWIRGANQEILDKKEIIDANITNENKNNFIIREDIGEETLIMFQNWGKVYAGFCFKKAIPNSVEIFVDGIKQESGLFIDYKLGQVIFDKAILGGKVTAKYKILKTFIVPENAITWALLRYSPHIKSLELTYNIYKRFFPEELEN